MKELNSGFNYIFAFSSTTAPPSQTDTINTFPSLYIWKPHRNADTQTFFNHILWRRANRNKYKTKTYPLSNIHILARITQ